MIMVDKIKNRQMDISPSLYDHTLCSAAITHNLTVKEIISGDKGGWGSRGYITTWAIPPNLQV